MIQHIKDSAEAVGIEAVITNSEQKIEVQLNSLTRDDDRPIMLVSWDIDTTISFDEHGLMNNPEMSIVALLVEKAPDLTKVELENTAEEMADLFKLFLQDLYRRLIPVQRSLRQPITNATYKYVPKHGAGKHSGVLAKWNQYTGIINCKV